MHPIPPSTPYKIDSEPNGQQGSGDAGTPPLNSGFDAGLVHRIATGDEPALGILYDRWSPLLSSLAFSILRNAEDVEEVLEATFWQAWRQAGRYSGERGTVSTWLTMMLRSRALDRLRARRRSREDAWDGVTEPSGENAPDIGQSAEPLQAALATERSELVRRALDDLPAEQRQVVEMAYFAGLSQTEIAEATGSPLGTVKTRARLALQKLRDALSMLREDQA